MGIEQLHYKADIPQLIEGAPITNLMYLIWCSRKDLRLAFDLGSREGQERFCQWYQVSVLREYGFSPAGGNQFSRADPGTVRPLNEKPFYTIVVRMEDALIKLSKVLPSSFREQGKIIWIRLLAKIARNESLKTQNVRNSGDGALTTATSDFHAGTPGANLIGYALSESGMGEHVRMSAASFDAIDMRFGVVNFDCGVPSRKKAELRHGVLESANKYNTNIFHINADQMLHVYTAMGEKFFSNRFNISYPFWELSKFPLEWVPFLKMMDEVWAPTKFIQESISNALGKEVRHMPIAIELPPVKNVGRKYFGIPDGKYTFLVTFDFYSFIHRKNPWAALRAFILAFPRGDENVSLIIKVMNGDERDSGWGELKEIASRDKRIVLINNVMTKDELLSLKLACDCYVSLHRAEGLGLGPMEAMLLGKPTIVTNYSGSTDYAKESHSCLVNYLMVPIQEGQYVHCAGQVWADPDIEHAARHMRRIAGDVSLSNSMGKAAQQYISENFSPSRCGAIYKQRMNELGLL